MVLWGGGLTGQVLTKQSNNDYDIGWQTNNIPLSNWMTTEIVHTYNKTIWLSVPVPYTGKTNSISVRSLGYYNHLGTGNPEELSNDIDTINYIGRYTNSVYISITFKTKSFSTGWGLVRIYYNILT